MERELEKIHAYFAEVSKTWSVNPELVISKQFFELWEESHQPKAFTVKKSIEVLDQKIACPEKAVAYFTWDFSEESPCLILEFSGSTDKYNFFISDGNIDIDGPHTTELDDDHLNFGERLEFIMDIISYVRKYYPSRNVKEMK